MTDLDLRDRLVAAADALTVRTPMPDPDDLDRRRAARATARRRGRAAGVGVVVTAVAAAAAALLLATVPDRPVAQPPAARVGDAPQLGTVPLTGDLAVALTAGSYQRLGAARAGLVLARSQYLDLLAVPFDGQRYCLFVFLTAGARPGEVTSVCDTGLDLAAGTIRPLLRAGDRSTGFVAGEVAADVGTVTLSRPGASETAQTYDGGAELLHHRFFVAAYPYDKAVRLTAHDATGRVVATADEPGRSS